MGVSVNQSGTCAAQSIFRRPHSEAMPPRTARNEAICRRFVGAGPVTDYKVR